MVGREELARLRLEKQTLVLESRLNRLSLQAEWQELRRAGERVTSPLQRANPWLLLGAAAAGFFLLRSLRRRESLFGRVTSLLKWVQPLYGLWSRLRARSQHQGQPQADSP